MTSNTHTVRPLGPDSFRALRGANLEAHSRGERVRERAPVGVSEAFTLSDGTVIGADFNGPALSSGKLDALATLILHDSMPDPDAPELADHDGLSDVQRARRAKVRARRADERRKMSPVGYRFDSKAEVVPSGLADDVRVGVKRSTTLEGVDVARDEDDGPMTARLFDDTPVSTDVLDCLADDIGRYRATPRTRPMPATYAPETRRVRRGETRVRTDGPYTVVSLPSYLTTPWEQDEETGERYGRATRVRVGFGPWQDRPPVTSQRASEQQQRAAAERARIEADTARVSVDRETVADVVRIMAGNIGPGETVEAVGEYGTVRVRVSTDARGNVYRLTGDPFPQRVQVRALDSIRDRIDSAVHV